MDGQKTPTTRVVVDLEKACRYELVPGGDNKFTLKLYTDAVSAKAETKAAPKAPAAKLVMASAPVVSKPAVVVASAPVAEKKPAAVGAKTTASPTDFVFVEPSYKPKDETTAAKPTVEPSVKALEAAAKFADKPASELVAMKPSASLQQGAASQPAVNLAAEQKAQMTQTPATSGPKYTGEPISVNLKDVDLKDFFRLIHEISGLNVVLDPNVHGSLTVVLDDVPWDQALDIVLKNNDLARQLEGNVLRIATVETLEEGSGCASRADRIRSAGRGESHGHALPELCALERCRSDRQEVPLAAWRCYLRRPYECSDHLGHSERRSDRRPTADSVGSQDSGS